MTERERDEFDWPEVDPINAALMPLIDHIFAVTADGSPERKAAMCEVLELPARIRTALLARNRFN